MEQIQFEFDQLQHELEADISAGEQDAREKLLDNFDQEVVEKVRIQSHDFLDRFNQELWQVTRYVLAEDAAFDETGYSFLLKRNPFSGEDIFPGPYRMGAQINGANTYRVGHPLAQRILDRAKIFPTPCTEVIFDYTSSGKHIAALEPLVGKSGLINCAHFSVTALETEDHLLLAGFVEDGTPLDTTQCQRLFDLSGRQRDASSIEIPATAFAKLQALQLDQQHALLEEMTSRNANWFDVEMDKLDHWAEDRRASLKVELEELDDSVKETRKAARNAPNLPEKLERQRELRKLEAKRDTAWHNYDEASRELDRQKEALLDEISHRLKQLTNQENLFIIRWRIQ